MTTTPKHEPTRWYAGGLDIYDGDTDDARIIASLNDEEPAELNLARAAFIVLAVNNHEALVEALRAALEELVFVYKGYEAPGGGEVEPIPQLRAAIAAAEGRTE